MGNVVEHIVKDGKLEKIGKPTLICGGEPFKDARIVLNHEGELDYYGLLHNGVLMRYVEGMTGVVA